MKSVRLKKKQRVLWTGISFMLVATFVMVAALNTGANLLYLVAGGLISFIILSLWLSRASLRRMVLTREAPTRVHRGEVFPMSLRIENRKLFLPAISVSIESLDRPGESMAYILRVPSRKAALVQSTGVFPKRGLHLLPDINLVTAFPFGLIEVRARVHDKHEVLVYPRVFPIRSSVLDTLAGVGNIPKRSLAEGDEFFSLRDYVRGDDPRRIAWRPSARRRTLVVREMDAHSTRIFTLYLDTRRLDVESFDDRFEEAVEVAASLAVALLARRYAVALAAPGLYQSEGEGPSQARRILEALARIEPVDPDVVGAFPEPVAAHRRTAQLLVSPDASRWGLKTGTGMRVLDPREVAHA